MIYRFPAHQSFSGYPARFPGFGYFPDLKYDFDILHLDDSLN
jgi:hypothetical protein